MLTIDTILLALVLPVVLLAILWNKRAITGRGHRRRRALPAEDPTESRLAPKPPWVRHEVIRLKALMPGNGCRKIAATFNHLHQQRRRMTVGKSYVASVIRNAQLEIVQCRKEIKHRLPCPLPKNLQWAADLTQVRDAAGCRRMVFGLIDQGTRACLALSDVRTKASVTLVRALLDAVERYGTPKVLRTDNEACFTSKLFRLGLLLLGIRHRTSAPFAPWQNGRIERFFLTFKERWRAAHICLDERGELQPELGLFRFWYNHARPHQHLDGLTPAMAWAGVDTPRGRGRFFAAWDGWLAGYAFKT